MRHGLSSVDPFPVLTAVAQRERIPTCAIESNISVETTKDLLWWGVRQSNALASLVKCHCIVGAQEGMRPLGELESISLLD